MSRRISRRNFLALLGAGTVVGLASSASPIQLSEDKITLFREIIKIPDLPKPWIGYRIGFLSDTHLGPFITSEWVDNAVRLLLEEGIDLLLLGGDLISKRDVRVKSELVWATNHELTKLTGAAYGEAAFRTACKILAQELPPDGIVAVYGNHDRWVGPDIFERSCTENQIELLCNNNHQIKRGESTLAIYGADDYWTGIPTPPNTFQGYNASEVRLVLSHNPDYIAELLKPGDYRFQLGLCGHTHGGQIALPGLGPPFINIRDKRLGAGLAQIGETSVYTSRGIGVVELPFRIGVPAEATHLTLTSA